MGDLLTTSVSGMLSYQRALNVTAHNIANVNTPGYSRQVAEFTTRPGQATGAGFIGSGVQITTIKRIYDELLGQQLQTSITSQARFATMGSFASRIDGLLASPETGLSPSMQSFFNSLQDLVNDPASLPARQALLGEAEGFVQRLQAIDGRFREIDAEVNGRLQQAVADINRLATSIANINNEVVLAQGRTGQPPNDLLDQRDGMIRELSGLIGISTTPQDDGAINVFIGTGQSLVIGTLANTLAVTNNEFDPSRFDVVYRTSGGDSPLDTRLTGGAIGGLLEFRADILDSARQALGETALALATTFNAQHAAGMDLRGALGGDFFSLGPTSVLPSSNNAGTGAITVSIADIGALAGTEYVMEFDGAVYSLRDLKSGQLVAMAGTGTVVDPFLADGLSIVTSGAPVAGDQFMLRPSRDVAAGLSVAVTDVQSIAMAVPTRTLSGSSNIGDAAISAPQIVDRDDAALLATSVILFTAPNTYSINGAGAFAYTSGDPIVINGSQFTITGMPQTGDQFTLESNAGGFGDNGNGLLLGQIQTQGLLRGGTASINDNYGRLIANVGTRTSQIHSNLGAQNVILANIEDEVSSRSGVNLDEEAARLIQFQQAYQALAQIVSVASTLFDTLLDAVRR